MSTSSKVVVRNSPWTRQPPAGTALDYNHSLARFVSIAGTFSSSKLFEARTRKWITPSPTPNSGIDEGGSWVGGSGIFTVPTTIFKVNSEWSLFFLFKCVSDPAAAAGRGLFYADYNAGYGDALSVVGPDYRNSFDRFYISNLGNYAGANGASTANPSYTPLGNSWVPCMWSHPSSGAGTFYYPKGSTSIAAANTPVGGESNSMFVNAFGAYYRLSNFILFNKALSSTVYRDFSANPWQIFQP